MKKVIFFFLAISCLVQSFAQGSLNISSGTTVKPTGGVYLVFNDVNLINNGTLQQAAGDGTIKFAGAGDETISGTGTSTIDSLVLAKGSTANLNLQSDISIVSQVNFISGLLNFGDRIINLGSSAAFKNESGASRAYSNGTGYAQSSSILNTPLAVNVGNLGAIITSAANLGSTVVRRGFIPITHLGNANILRYYVISPTNNSSLNATLRFQYLDAELNGVDESTLDLLRSTDSITWSDQFFTTRDAVNNYVEKTGLSDFSFWTLGSSSVVLPVIMGPLNAYKVNTGIKLSWQTFTEDNVSKYFIERSIDGSHFSSIGDVLAIGASLYTYLDAVPVNGDNFYRLQIVDKDASSKYSSIVTVSLSNASARISFYPNPIISHTVTVQLTNMDKGTYQFRLFDNAGKNIYQSVIQHAGGSSSRTIYLPLSIGSGIYNVQMKNKQAVFTESLLVR